jgi:hypothetical protein
MFYLTDETRLGGMIVKWQNSTDRQIDRWKKGLADPYPAGSVVWNNVEKSQHVERKGWLEGPSHTKDRRSLRTIEPGQQR